MERLTSAAKHLKGYAALLRALRGALPIYAPSMRELAEDVDGVADSLQQMANEQTTAARIAADFGKARE